MEVQRTTLGIQFLQRLSVLLKPQSNLQVHLAASSTLASAILTATCDMSYPEAVMLSFGSSRELQMNSSVLHAGVAPSMLAPS